MKELKKIMLKGRFVNGQVFLDGRPLPLAPSLKLRNHSPSGFMWGYAGSGPAQTALAVLLQASGDAAWATKNYQRFKFEFISRLPQADFEVEIDLPTWAKKVIAWDKVMEWANAQSYIIHRIDPEKKKILVDKVPQEWFAAQWKDAPEGVTSEDLELVAFYDGLGVTREEKHGMSP